MCKIIIYEIEFSKKTPSGIKYLKNKILSGIKFFWKKIKKLHNFFNFEYFSILISDLDSKLKVTLDKVNLKNIRLFFLVVNIFFLIFLKNSLSIKPYKKVKSW